MDGAGNVYQERTGGMNTDSSSTFAAATIFEKGKDSMRTQLQQRLEALQSEYDAGRCMLSDLETRRVNLEQTLLRISGAIQVLQEELGVDEQPTGTDKQAQEVISVMT
jgi:hypothetical protein